MKEQSITHTKAQVEEETIERYERWLDSGEAWNSREPFKRKYSK